MPMLTDDQVYLVLAGALAAGAGVLNYLERREAITPYHTSILTGKGWLQELLDTDNQHRFYEQLGMRKHTFLALVDRLTDLELATSTRHMDIDEQVAIFLYTMVTNASNRKVAERFQRSGETVSRVFHKILEAIINPSFYCQYVQQPTETTPLPTKYRKDKRFYPYLAKAIGAIDGVHTHVTPLEGERAPCRNRKGQLSLNHLAACNFDMEFTYVLAGWEGSVADGFLFTEAVNNAGLLIPPQSYYLGDAGFACTKGLLVPFRGVRYHLREWLAGSNRPENRNELYNLRHATYRNVIERIFGVVKRRWRIVRETSHYDLETSAKIMSASAALHNFIRKHDKEDLPEPWESDEESDGDEDEIPAAAGPSTSRSAVTQASRLRDSIADAMWEKQERVRTARRAQATARNGHC